MAKSLYICYFGVREPLVQTQVLPYLLELVKGGHQISLVTFEPAEHAAELRGDEGAALKSRLTGVGVDWNWLPYHKRFSVAATAYDIFRGAMFVRSAINNGDIDILHSRVHVPALMAAIARSLTRRKPKLLFDIRGFMPEEYTDAGLWPKDGWLYRATKRVEAWLMRQSDGFVVLTERARSLLFPESKANGFDRLGRPVEVIPCCVDFEKRFAAGASGVDQNAIAAEYGLEDRYVIIHVGALTGLYLADEIADFLAAARKMDPSTFAIFLTQTAPAEIIGMLKERGFGETDYLVKRVAPDVVPAYLELSDAALSFVRAGYATASRSPTKIPEYLACGVPIIANKGVGDVDDLIERNRVGVTIKSFDEESYEQALAEVRALGEVASRCRETAVREFDLKTVAGVRYRRLYDRLLNRDGKKVERAAE
jgi:glycosyltransferase involved in cell wall biosynthesis